MKTLNLGIVAHADAGKTTLTEQILYLTGAIRAAGSVDRGTASTDSLAVERERGISVKAASASVGWNDARLNFIDAPGHADFLSEVERSLSVLDGAVLVLSSVEGVQPQAKMLLQAFRRAKLPCFLFCNKLDRAGSSWEKTAEEAGKLLGVPVLPLTEASGEGTEDVKIAPLSFKDPAREERAVMACGEDALLEAYLEDPEKALQALPEALKNRVTQGELIPVVCGASKYGLGVPELLDALTAYLEEPAPLGEELCARVYQVEHDPVLGKAAYVRIFSGRLQARQALIRPGGEEKITRLRRVRGRKLEDGEEALPNEIAVVYGLSSIRAGELLGTALPGLREYRLSEPLMLVRAEEEAPAKQPELAAALRELGDEDPTLKLEWNRKKREIWLHISGRIQLEVLAALLLERWGLKVKFGAPSVIYRETPEKPGEGFEGYWAPKPCWAVVRLRIEPLPQGSGFQYESVVSPGRLPNRYQAHIATAVPRALTQGPKGWQVTDLKVTLIDGESHHVHTHPLDFFVATPMAVADGLRNTGTKLLEPMLQAEFSGPEDCLGKTIGLLTAHRASFESPEMGEGEFHLEAVLPASESFELPAEFAAATGGRGIYGSRFSHYEPCPPGVGETRERLGVDPLDRPRFILAARSALAEENF